MAAIIPIALSNGKVGLGSSTFSNGIMFYESGVLGTVLVFSLSLLFSDYFVFRFVKVTSKNISPKAKKYGIIEPTNKVGDLDAVESICRR